MIVFRWQQWVQSYRKWHKWLWGKWKTHVNALIFPWLPDDRKRLTCFLHLQLSLGLLQDGLDGFVGAGLRRADPGGDVTCGDTRGTCTSKCYDMRYNLFVLKWSTIYNLLDWKWHKYSNFCMTKQEFKNRCKRKLILKLFDMLK